MATPSIDIIFRIFASNPPSIAFACGTILILVGSPLGNSQMINSGWLLIFLGFILQLIWLFGPVSHGRR